MVLTKDTELIQSLFEGLDQDKNGSLDHLEVMSGLTKFLGPSVAQFECDRIFIAAKQNKEDGEINMD